MNSEIGNFSEDMQRALQRLTELEREVIIRECVYGESQEQIGDAMCYEHQHISRIRAGALAKLRVRIVN